ncbi:MAG: hypothetical protein KGL39_43510 [Patescibacteria group bacterium]|nr:hypothetical protein [Patescibacteria group bacterium]
MSSSRTWSALASGTIQPCTFVKIDTGGNQHVLAAGSGDFPIGISQEGTKQSSNYGTTYAAQSGDFVQVHPPGDVCLLVIGSGGCTAGDLLKPDSSGNGVTGTAGTDKTGAVALETAAQGEKCLVLVERHAS